MWIEPTTLTVPVDGGQLRVARWGSGANVVLASHGITANHRSFGEVASQLLDRGTDVTLYAVDHRGRGGSVSLPGPYGLAAHARDLVAVLDHLDVGSATLLGHSMGAFIVAVAAELAPSRVERLVVVDGALPIPVELPDDADVEAVVRSVIGPALDRLDRTFASPDECVAMWQEHSAVGGRYFNDVTDAYVRYDLTTDGSIWRPNVSKAAVLDDGESTLVDTEARTALERIHAPTVLLWAPRGLLDEPPGLFSTEQVDEVVARLPHVRAARVTDANHYSIVFGPHGAAQVADAVESEPLAT